jgi:hypothetical protein
MNQGAPQTCDSPTGDHRAARRHAHRATGDRTLRAGLLLVGLISTLLLASSAQGATATVGLATAESYSVLAGSTVTNTGPTTMFGDLGLSPGSSVTGAPQVLGATHVDDAVAIGAKNSLTTAYNDAASRPSNGSAGTDLAGQVFLPGVRTAGSSLLLSSGSVTLDAQGDPGAVFIFKIGSTLVTGSNTTVALVNGAQACHVFWQIGSSATLGTGTRFAGTVMALASIAAKTGATIHGRLLARTGAVTLDTNTITASNCAGGSETQTPAERSAGILPPTAGSPTTKPLPSSSPLTPAQRAAKRKAVERRAAVRKRALAHRALPHKHGTFTG